MQSPLPNAGAGDPGHEGLTIVAGVDGGGTHTRVSLLRSDGVLLGVGEAPSGNLHDVGRARLAEHMQRAWAEAWRAAGQAPRAVEAAFLAMASVGLAADRAEVLEVACAVGLAPPARTKVDIDLTAALAGGLAGAPGIALIVGTGSSCYGRRADGLARQVGGWGSMLDDVGSATWLGTRAMTAAARAFDGRGPATVLQERVREALGISEMRAMLRAVDADGLSRARRASLAKLVTAAAREGDAVANQMLDEGADALAECVEAAARVLEWSAPPLEVVATGGLATDPDYGARVSAAIARRVPMATVVAPRLENVVGAAVLALALTGRPLAPAALERLERAEGLRRTDLLPDHTAGR
ncbi:MAG: BadF/BadG/BcrA/BcrD ATPase family protein [Planctomycetota bacterium]